MLAQLLSAPPNASVSSVCCSISCALCEPVAGLALAERLIESTPRPRANRSSRGNKNDAVFVFSVGGGNLEKNVSANIVAALKEAKERGMKIFGVVGRDGGYTKKVGDNVILIPTVDAARVTPHTEAFHAVVWHCLVSHPALQQIATKW